MKTTIEDAGETAVIRNLDETVADAMALETFEEALQLLARQVRELVGAHQSAVSYLPDGDFTAGVHTHSFSVKYERYKAYDVMPTGDGIWAVIVRERMPARMTHEDLLSHPRWKNFSDLKTADGLEHPPMRGWLACPVLRRDGGVLGVLQLSDKYEGEFTEEDEKVVQRLALMISPTFELQYLNEQHCSLEARLRQSEKMQALGVLAGGIAHSFNNHLASVMVTGELLLLKMAGNTELRPRVQAMLEACLQGKQLVQQILNFSRQDQVERRPLEIHRVVTSALALVKASLPSAIELREDIAQGTGVVLGDPTKIQQVVVNLCTNAYQAVGEHAGVLSVSLQLAELDAGSAGSEEYLPAGRYAKLSISDTGSGMDEATRRQMFDPFFTTKPLGQGTGMGLSVVRGTVMEHGGGIVVRSAPGQGTTVDVYFPRCSESVATETDERATPMQRTGRVLFIDDEATFVEASHAVLTGLGYDVAALTNGVEALETFRADPDGFDIVITDQAMSELSGIELARGILRIRPDLPILLITGYNHTMTAERAQELGLCGFLSKPYTSGDLAQAIEQALRERP